MFTVVVTEKGGARQTLKFDEEVISIGRVQGNEIVLPRGNVSKRHAKIEYKDGKFIVSDAGSTNGTYLNGRRVQKATRILASDKLYVGDYIVALEGHDALNPEQVADEDVESIETIEEFETIEEPGQEVVSFLDPLEGRATIEQEQSPGPRVPRPEPKEKPRAPSISIVPEKKAPRPKPRVKPPVKKTVGVADTMTKTYTLVETILDRVSREIKRVDKTRAPVKLDVGTAGQVRIVIDDIVDDLVSRGKLPPDVSANVIKGKAFRAAVDLGPMDAWLDDDEIKMIRITQPASAYLFRDGQWTEATNNFLARDDMTQAIRCLGAGLEAHDAVIHGISSFRLEEGFRVFASTLSSAVSNPSVFVDKTACTAGPENKPPLVQAAHKILEAVIEQKRNILVVGSSISTRITVLESIMELIPSEDFIVTFEKLPFSLQSNPKRIVLNAQGQSMNSKTPDTKGILISHALSLEPDWIAMGGTEMSDILDVLRTAALRSGVVAELPVGKEKNLDLELTASMAASGATLPLAETAILVGEAFDIVVVATRDKNGQATVDAICKGTYSDGGRWIAKKLYDNSKQ